MTFQLAQDTRTKLFRPKQDMGLKLVLRSITRYCCFCLQQHSTNSFSKQQGIVGGQESYIRSFSCACEQLLLRVG